MNLNCSVNLEYHDESYRVYAVALKMDNLETFCKVYVDKEVLRVSPTKPDGDLKARRRTFSWKDWVFDNIQLEHDAVAVVSIATLCAEVQP